MTDVPLSILDIALVSSGQSASEALGHTVTLALEAERLGFRRFWVAEHHGTPAFASVAPAVLVGWLAAETESIRVGSGGVMLPNHSPFIVAEQFASIGALAGDRIDLGIGKGTGAANPAAAEILLRGEPAPVDEAYAGQVRQLLGYFTPGGSSVVGAPMPESYPPQVWLLGSGESSAALAAELGLPMAVAHHIRPGRTESALEVYRRQFKPSRWLDRPHAMVSVSVICGETSERAEELAQPYEVLIAQALAGQKSPLSTPDQAAKYSFTPREREVIATLSEGGVRGDAGQVQRGLAAFTDRFRPDELIVTVPMYEIQDRLRTLEVIAGKS
ncbi:MAG TPA: LLM class flavin-dependent oxidoreductase [Trebonia sp.]|nr:LLM class flavin-dependent oxidoreductase [Trebonia sp.]